MRIRTLRYYTLLFAVGLSWGFIAKTFASTHFYIGYDDPQVVDSADVYPIERLLDIDREPSQGNELLPAEEDVQSGESDIGPQGTISI